jgi:hypothetical protein
MEKIVSRPTDTDELAEGERLLSDGEVDAVAGGFVIYGGEFGCSNNLRLPAVQLPAVQLVG